MKAVFYARFNSGACFVQLLEIAADLVGVQVAGCVCTAVGYQHIGKTIGDCDRTVAVGIGHFNCHDLRSGI